MQDEYTGESVQVADGVYEVVRGPRERQWCPDCGHIHFYGEPGETLHPLPDQSCGSFDCCIP